MRTKYANISEARKDKILEKIRKTGMSIKDASENCNVSQASINKMFAERYGSRERKTMELKKEMEKQLNQFKQLNN